MNKFAVFLKNHIYKINELVVNNVSMKLNFINADGSEENENSLNIASLGFFFEKYEEFLHQYESHVQKLINDYIPINTSTS